MLPHLLEILQLLMVTYHGVAWAVPSVSVTWTSSSGSAPDFAEPMGNVTVPVGREAVLSCTVSNLGQYKVGWMKADDQTILSLHTRVITHNPRISVTHDDNLRTWQLRIRQLKESDRGCYMCQINTNAMKKQLGCVDVQVPPDIDDGRTSGDKTVAEGDNVTLTCEATGHPKPRILWRREDGDHILLPVSSQELQKVDSYTGSSLNLVRLQRRQMGAYLCIASNDVPPAVSKRIVLNINFHPSVQVQTPLTGALQETSTKLKCDVEAFPAPRNYWIKEQDGVLLNGSKYRIEEKMFDYRYIMILTIMNVSSTDFGTYNCISTNIIGKDSGSVRLYEIKRPTTAVTPTTTTTESYLFLEILSTPQNTEYPFLSNTIGNAAKALGEDSSENLLYPSLAPRQLELETHSRTVSVFYHSKSVLAFLMSMYVLR